MTDRDHIPLHKSDCALLIGGYQCTCGFHQRQNKTPTALAAERPAPTVKDSLTVRSRQRTRKKRLQDDGWKKTREICS